MTNDSTMKNCILCFPELLHKRNYRTDLLLKKPCGVSPVELDIEYGIVGRQQHIYYYIYSGFSKTQWGASWCARSFTRLSSACSFFVSVYWTSCDYYVDLSGKVFVVRRLGFSFFHCSSRWVDIYRHDCPMLTSLFTSFKWVGIPLAILTVYEF